MTTIPIIDVWMQHPTAQFLKQPFFESLRRWTGQLPTYEIPVRMTLDSMEAAGVSMGLLNAWLGPHGALINNDEVAAIVREYPTRFVGVASVDLHRPMAAVRELRRCVTEQGFKALRVVPWLWDLPPNDRRYYPLYAECCELRVPVCTQVGHTGPLCRSETGRPIPYVEEVALDFPELTIVCGHIGFPWTSEMLSLLRKFPNVYLDTSAYVAKRYPPEIVDYLTGSGRAKILFGTNYPMMTHKKCLENLGTLGLDDETCRSFLWENAARLFGLPDPEA